VKLMSGKFHNELEELKQQVNALSELAKWMLENSVAALKNQDMLLAREVVSKKCELAVLDEEIEKESFRLLTLYQPMARDMREIACSLKMITYLTRIGRYGKDIGVIALELGDVPYVHRMVSIPWMSNEVCAMIDDAMKAFNEKDVKYIKDFQERDDDIDAMRYSIFRDCLTYMMEDQHKITQCTHYVMIARYLERCGDHALKMAEKIHYMVTGEHIDLEEKACETPTGS